MLGRVTRYPRNANLPLTGLRVSLTRSPSPGLRAQANRLPVEAIPFKVPSPKKRGPYNPPPHPPSSKPDSQWDTCISIPWYIICTMLRACETNGKHMNLKAVDKAQVPVKACKLSSETQLEPEFKLAGQELRCCHPNSSSR